MRPSAPGGATSNRAAAVSNGPPGPAAPPLTSWVPVDLPNLALADDDPGEGSSHNEWRTALEREIPLHLIEAAEREASRTQRIDDDEPQHLETAEQLALVAAATTDTGEVRNSNDDRVLCRPEKRIFAVVDGMFRAGALAAEITVEALFEATWSEESAAGSYAEQLIEALQRAHKTIQKRALELKSSELGAALVTAYFPYELNRAYIVHVGDSRCYRLRDGELTKLTTDHTLEALGEVGRRAGRLTRAIGVTGDLQVELTIDEPKRGDVYLFCSDGLWKQVDEARVRAVLDREADPHEASKVLVREAAQRGGRDNASALVVRVS